MYCPWPHSPKGLATHKFAVMIGSESSRCIMDLPNPRISRFVTPAARIKVAADSGYVALPVLLEIIAN